MLKSFRAFTLAEIMIVLTVIGVLTAILLPVALTSSPDENVMKFKKGNATFGKIVTELINNDKYFTPGDFGKLSNGNLADSPKYFCECMADVISTKFVSCSEAEWSGSGPAIVYVSEDWKINGTIGDEIDDFFDARCKEYVQGSGAEITTPDGIVYYELGPKLTFSYPDMYLIWDKKGTEDKNYGNTYWGTKPESGNGFYYTYKPFCMDVDGIGKGEDPFGYGVRVDGKIFYGARAKEWMKKSIQKGDE